MEHRAGGRAPAAHGRHDASSSTCRRAAGTSGGAPLVSATDHRDLRHRAHSGHRHRAVAQSERHQLARGGVGSGTAARVRDLRAPGAARPEVVSHPGRRDHQDAEFLVRRIGVRVRRDREAAFESRSDFRFSGPPGDHLRLGAVRDPLLPGRDAARGQGIRGTDEQGDGGEWRRESQRRRLDLHGSDGGAAHDPPVSPGNDPLRADDGHDRGDGACVGVDHGRLHRHGHRSAASAHRGDHDGARYHHDGEDHRAGNRDAADPRRRSGRDSAHRREHRGRGGARYHRRTALDAQRHRDAGLVRRPRRAAQRRIRLGARLRHLVPGKHPNRSRLGLPADRVRDGRAVARLRDDRRLAGHPHGAERVPRLRTARADASAARSRVVHHRHVRAVRLR